MNIIRTIKTGAFVWLMIFLSFIIMSTIPLIAESENIQKIIIMILIIPFVIYANKYYYKTETPPNVLALSVSIMIISLTLDAAITIPFIIIPQGGTYLTFLTDPGILIMGIEILLVSYFFAKFKSDRKLILCQR